MSLLILGLVLFLGIHSINILAPGKRLSLVSSLGATKWKLLFTIVSVAGLILVIAGYAQARMTPTMLWMPPAGLRHLALLLTVPAFILLAAAYVPGNRIKAKLGHPMYVSVKVWAFAHLLANGTVADVLLFGSFLVWAIAGFAISRRRDRLSGRVVQTGKLSADIATVITGVISWAVFAMFLHTILIGVSPLP